MFTFKSCQYWNNRFVIQLLILSAGDTPLIIATRDGHTNIVQYLIANNANIEATDM